MMPWLARSVGVAASLVLASALSTAAAVGLVGLRHKPLIG